MTVFAGAPYLPRRGGYPPGLTRWVVLVGAMVTAFYGGGIPSLPRAMASSVPPISNPQHAGVVDELVEVGGARLHVRCSGEGRPTVVLIAGFNDGGDN
jgi:hypothetical protein